MAHLLRSRLLRVATQSLARASAPAFAASASSSASYLSTRVAVPLSLTAGRYLSTTSYARQAATQFQTHEDRQGSVDGASTAPTVLYSTVENSISKGTYDAITKDFKYSQMSEVQAAVLDKIDDLLRSTRGIQSLPSVEVGKDISEQELASIESGSDEGPLDLLAKARTGTGKTLAFLIPALDARVKAIAAASKGVGLSPAFVKRLKTQSPDLSKFDWQTMSSSKKQDFGRQIYARASVGALIISPTRELAAQIADEAVKLSKRHSNITVHLCVGGENKGRQLGKLEKETKDIIVATPGRLMDLLNDSSGLQKAVSAAETFILDEADTLLDMGFKEDITQISSYLPPVGQRRTLLFSATVSRDIQNIATTIMGNRYKYIDCVPEGEVGIHERIPQFAHIVEPEDQLPTIARLIAQDQLLHGPKSKVIVFSPTTKMTQLISEMLRSPLIRSNLPATIFDEKKRGASPATDSRGSRDRRGRGGRGGPPQIGPQSVDLLELHSQLDQNQRSKRSDAFRKASVASVLCTTDVSARGVDYPNVTRVIQIGGGARDQYVHRLGRTGRAGKEGRGDMVLIRGWEDSWIRAEGQEFPIEPVPKSAETLRQQVQQAWDDKKASHSGTAPDSEDAALATSDASFKSDFESMLLDHVGARLAAKESTGDGYDNERTGLKAVWGTLLGAFIPHTNWYRLSKPDVLDGLMRYGKGALGLEIQDMRLSDNMQRNLGLLGGGGSRGGSRSSRGGSRDYGAMNQRGGRSSFGGREGRGGDRGSGGFQRRDRYEGGGNFGARSGGGARGSFGGDRGELSRSGGGRSRSNDDDW